MSATSGTVGGAGPAREPALFIGLMSGTSTDGVDGVLADFSSVVPHVIADVSAPFDDALRGELLALNGAGGNELHRAALAANRLALVQAEVVAQLLTTAGLTAAQVRAVGSHGQTVRHCPRAFDGVGYTIQLNQPALLAERCGIDVVADFRSRDIAAGGQGAPLTPIFHRFLFGRPDATVAVLNLGGMANLSVIPPSGPVRGWDCGPGNALLDLWVGRHHPGARLDEGGRWAASGRVRDELLDGLLQEPFLALPPPKSTGRDLFSAAWLDGHLGRLAHSLPAPDVQATLAEFTAAACARDLLRQAPDARELLVCGGGAMNADLMTRLSQRLHNVHVASTASRGVHPQQVEALAFAWLAAQALDRQALETPDVTGASGDRVLGAVWPR